MPGQRIYYVPPRLVGAISEWSGMDAPDGKSWLLRHAADLGFNALWFTPFFEATDMQTVNKEGHPQTGSLYAIRRYCVLDPEFSATKITEKREKLAPEVLAEIDSLDRQHLEYFTAQARSMGLSVMADLVFNHVASDHPLVSRENKDIGNLLAQWQERGETPRLIYGGENNQSLIGITCLEETYFFKFCRNDRLEVLNFGMTTGFDTAQINYASPEARVFFITGKDKQPGYWKEVIDWHLDRGFTGFRCDMAYAVPPDWWQEIINHTRAKNPDVVFLAETLGGPDDKVEGLSKARSPEKKDNDRAAFDLGMVGTHWWNFVSPWLPENENPRINKMAKFGGAGAPDTHDTDGTMAGILRKNFNNSVLTDEMVAQICLRNYALSVLACNSSFMQMGYEYCNEKQNGVFRGANSPADWEALCKERAKDGAAGGHALDISAQIRAINDLKKDLRVENCRVVFKEFSRKQNGYLAKIHCEFIDVDTNNKTAEIILVVNKKPEKGPVVLEDQDLLDLEKSGLKKQAFHAGPGLEAVMIYHTPLEPLRTLEKTRKPAAPGF